MYSLPTTIKIRDNDFKIRNRGDYRIVLECFSALQDTELSEEERVISSLIIFYEDINSYEDVVENFNSENITEVVEKMFDFFNCGQKSVGAKQSHKIIDWDQDEQIICAAINNVANTEIRSVEYCHWWTFMGYYLSVGESVMSTVVTIRDKIANNKKLETYEKDFKKDNPQYFNFDYRSVEQIKADMELRNMWEANSNGKK